MADGGISGQLPKRRLSEVCFAYRRSFGKYWWFTFFLRYVRRILSLLNVSR